MEAILHSVVSSPQYVQVKVPVYGLKSAGVRPAGGCGAEAAACAVRLFI